MRDWNSGFTGTKVSYGLNLDASGRVVRGEWVQQFIDESVSFPNGSHDDMVDAVSGANAMLGSGSVMYDFM